MRVVPKQSVRLAAVAERAGVSKATASKVLNDRPDVSQDARERVNRAAAELGYQSPSPASRGSGLQVWVAFSNLANHYSGTLLDGLLDEASALDVQVVLSQWGGASRPTPRVGSPAWLRLARSRGAAAFILITSPVTASHVETCRQQHTPLVVVDPSTHVPPGTMTVGATNWRGGVQATEHLIALGHRRIAFIGAPVDSTPGDERLAGFRRVLETEGIPIDPNLVRAGDFRYEDGLACLDLLMGPNPPTAIFAACDAVALGVLEAARLARVRVPEELSVIGFDDSYAALGASPQLTTVRQPLIDMGRLALRTAVSAVREEAVAPPMELATTLIVRGSTGPSRTRARVP